MTDQKLSSSATGSREPVGPWATGLAIFAAIVLMMSGAFGALEGFVAIVRDDFYVVTPHYLFGYDTTAWGWVHLLVGVVVAAAGFAIVAGYLWARIVGVIVAVLSALVNFLYIPYYPLWSMLIIALDVLVIWALCRYDREAADPDRY
ncbi:DUF7144 family membrane protein [Actinocorallia longicatena]|uniref:DUF7144 domain-containing protein n=1 Tax=Actinocorallia longicatena TaxID=111803 RepID=A0ABP6Q638_9ACTN